MLNLFVQQALIRYSSSKEVTPETIELVKRKCSGIALSETGAKYIEEEPCIGWVGGEIVEAAETNSKADNSFRCIVVSAY